MGPARTRTSRIFFEPMSKRRKGFPSEKKVKRGVRIVHGNKELAEKLGRNDLWSVRLDEAVQEVLPEERAAFRPA